MRRMPRHPSATIGPTSAMPPQMSSGAVSPRAATSSTLVFGGCCLICVGIVLTVRVQLLRPKNVCPQVEEN